MSIVHFKNVNVAPPAAAEPQPRKKIVIAVDGPAASGKGTLARKIAERLGYAYLDTGTLYRAVALATLEMGGDPSKVDDVKPALEMVKRHLTPELLASPALRRPDVSSAASKVAALPLVRSNLLTYQRAFAENPPGNVGGVVLDGRDIGTVVCPQADVKLFVTATAEERAKRRFKELQRLHPSLTFEAVLADIVQRDQRDTSREAAPSLAAADAHVMDTTEMTPDVVLGTAISIVQDTFLKASEK